MSDTKIVEIHTKDTDAGDFSEWEQDEESYPDTPDNYWIQVDDVSISDAIMLSTGRNPDGLGQLLKGYYDPYGEQHYPDWFNLRMGLITSAIRAGKIKTTAVSQNQWGYYDPIRTRINMDDFRQWCKGKKDFVVYEPQQAGQESAVQVKPAARGITKSAVINAFEGMYFDRDKWSKYLGDPPSWLKDCRLARGNKSTSAMWSPVLIAAALYDKKISIKKLDAVFVHLKDWADEWREVSASLHD